LALELERRLFNLGHAALVLNDPGVAPHVELIAEQAGGAGLITLITLDASATPAYGLIVPETLQTAERILDWLRDQDILLT
jgi:hypothetical protein